MPDKLRQLHLLIQGSRIVVVVVVVVLVVEVVVVVVLVVVVVVGLVQEYGLAFSHDIGLHVRKPHLYVQTAEPENAINICLPRVQHYMVFLSKQIYISNRLSNNRKSCASCFFLNEKHCENISETDKLTERILW